MTSASAGVVARMLKVPDGTIRVLVQATERVRIGEYIAQEPYLVARIEPLPDAVSSVDRARGADPQRPADLQRDHRADPVPARGAPARGHQPRRPVGARAPDRRRASDPDRREAGAARGGRRDQAPAAPLGDPRPRARGDPARHADPVRGPVGDREGTARVLPPRAAEGDPARARRGGRPSRPRSPSCASESRRPSFPSTRARPRTASSPGSSGCLRRPPSTA